MTPESHDEFVRLLGELVEGTATAEDQKQIRALVAEDVAAREYYYAFIRVHAHLLWKHGAVTSRAKPPGVLPKAIAAPPTRLAPPQPAARTTIRSVAAAFWHPIALMLVAGLISTGILIYVFSTKPAEQPVAQTSPQQSATETVAKIVGTTGVQWLPDAAPKSDSLRPGQRLVLTHGLAEITFNSQARVILEGPTELIVVHAAACRLSVGKLTAHVPVPAKGFKVHTPDGTVTDLGTQFGVFVKSEVGNRKAENNRPTSDVRPPTSTEVHVFQGRVDVADEVDVAEESDLPKSKTKNHPSEMLTAGQAVAMSFAGLERLPAADPFRFRTEVFDGGPRQVLVADDFESMPLGASGHVLGDWRTEYTNNRDQQIITVDPTIPSPSGRGHDEGESGSTVGPPLPAPVGRRAMEFTNSFKVLGKQGRQLHPIMTREVDGRQFPSRCKLLVECDILPRTKSVEPSISLTEDFPLRLAPGVELGREANPAAPKIEWRPDQWYRVRVVWDVENGVPRGATFERLQWRGSDGWVRDTSVQLPAPKLLSGPVAQVRFGFPAPLAGKDGGTYWLDNMRMEVLGEK